MKIYLFVFLLLPLSGLAQPLFTLLPPDRTAIHFQNSIVESPTQNVLAYEYFYNGGGVAVGDLNNDGLADIVFTANMEEPKIYFNRGNFNFEDVTKKSKIRADGWKTGVTMADVNGDGWMDIYICRSGNVDEELRRNLLFINQKDGTFKEMAAQYGIDDPGNSTQAVFFDYDNDGDLDLFVLNHSIKRMKNFDVAYMKAAYDSLAGDKLYRNDGNNHFTPVTKQAGIISNPLCFGLGVSVADFNQDGWPDMYVTNDYDEDDYLYINQKNGTFKESLAGYFGHTSKFSMGCDAADINDDGMTDMLTLDMLPEDNKRQKLLKGPDGYDHFQMLLKNGYYHQYMRNMLQIAQRNGKKIQFSEIGQLAGVSNTDWSWAPLFGDYDLDGWPDLFITNGYMRDYTNMDFLKYTAPEEIKKYLFKGEKPNLYEMVQKMPSSHVKNYLFRNRGDLSFENVTQKWGMDSPSLSNGAAYGDFDNDGDLDLVVNNINQPAFIWQNHAEDLKNNFLKIKFSGSKKNTFGIGAKVLVTAKDGFKQLQELEQTHGYQSSMEPCLIFGLGKRSAVTVTVFWSDGTSQIITDQSANKTILLEQKNARPSETKDLEEHPLFTEMNSDSLQYRHKEDDYNDFKREPLLPHQYSRNGPALAAGDVNGDGKKDFYIGGAKGQPGTLFINKGDGRFEEKKTPDFEAHNSFEDVNAVFGDFDQDGDQDLYVVSGGNEGNFQDRIYWNDGKGNFTYKPDILPVTQSTGGVVVAFDFDHDGDLDIFRSGQVTTGAYPEAPRSYLFENDHGVFKDVTPDFLKNIGMVNAAVTADINKDGIEDLILAGEFMEITILYGQQKTPFFSTDKQQKIPHSSGWWYCLKTGDLDKDGNLDIIAGNEGLNNQMKPAVSQPVTVDAADIDNNGTVDAIIGYSIKGKNYPMATRDEFLDQVPSFKTTFPSYESYSDATVHEIFSKEQLDKAIHLEAEEFRSGVFMNRNGEFHFLPFENAAQAFPVRDLLIGDFTHNGNNDLLLVGNNYAVRAQTGRQDAGKGLLLAQGAAQSFTAIPDNGFVADKDTRKIIRIDNFIIVANNNDKIQIFRIN